MQQFLGREAYKGSAQPMLMIMVMMTKAKPTYSLKPKKLFKLDLDRDINLTTVGNLI
jgi:hypothetical protein